MSDMTTEQRQRLAALLLEREKLIILSDGTSHQRLMNIDFEIANAMPALITQLDAERDELKQLLLQTVNLLANYTLLHPSMSTRIYREAMAIQKKVAEYLGIPDAPQA